MTDIIKTCYRAITKLNIPNKEKEALIKELFELGFTKTLKEELLEHLDKQDKILKKKIANLKMGI